MSAETTGEVTFTEEGQRRTAGRSSVEPQRENTAQTGGGTLSDSRPQWVPTFDRGAGPGADGGLW